MSPQSAVMGPPDADPIAATVAPQRTVQWPYYGRPCFICDRIGMCQHREPEVLAAIREAARAFHEALRGLAISERKGDQKS